MGGCLLRLTQMWSAVERKRRDIYSICGLGKDAGFERKAPSTSSSSGNSKKGGWKREGGPLRTVLAGGRERGDCWRRRERGVPVKERQWHRRREGGRGEKIDRRGKGEDHPLVFLILNAAPGGKMLSYPVRGHCRAHKGKKVSR